MHKLTQYLYYRCNKLTLPLLPVSACGSICHTGGPGGSRGGGQLRERTGKVVYAAGSRQTGWRGDGGND